MKIHILSDLHLEFAPFEPPPTDANVVVLAGDIAKDIHGATWARKAFPDKEIIYVCGNHEFYGAEREDVLYQLMKTCAENDIYFLENDSVVFNDAKTGEKVRFLGCTLWTDFEIFGSEVKSKCMKLGQKSLNDFRVIHENGERFTPEKSIELHEESLGFLAKELNTDFDGKTVVVTHHLPSIYSVSQRYKEDLLTACFASELSQMFGKMNLWIHGHTHDYFDYQLFDTRVICNPRGYVQGSNIENKEFNPAFVIEI